MTITTREQLLSALGGNASTSLIDKGSITGLANTFISFWRATGVPAQAAIPAAAAVCDHTLVGAVPFTQQTSPATSYAAWLSIQAVNTSASIELHDRLMHMGGLNGTLTTAQTVNLDLSTNLAVSNISARIGDSNYSDVSWWLEWYTATGATGVTANVDVTCDDGSVATVPVALGANRPASFMANMNLLLPNNGTRRFIRSVQSVTLTATTGTAGSFGVTATRQRTMTSSPIASLQQDYDWARLGFPQIFNSSCLFPIMFATTINPGIFVRGSLRLAHG